MEHILTPKVDNVRLVQGPSKGATGTLYITTTHLIFASSASESSSRQELWLQHAMMSHVEKPVLTTSGSQLRIVCSHFLSATFLINKDREAHDIYLSITALSKPGLVNELYAFGYKPETDRPKGCGWNFHDTRAEFQRQGVPNAQWAYCNLNEVYALCASYPRHLFVPATASHELIVGSAKFRSKARLPVLTFYYEHNNAALIRCAQPLVGMSGLRSQADELYFECLRRANTKGNDVIQVVDTRPAMNAMANRAGGKGYESEKYYENIAFNFKGIDNIHKMRQSIRGLINAVACNESNSMDAFLTELANCGWLRHVKNVLEASVFIVDKMLDQGHSVVVHCSDGWDRTAQTCSIAQILIDGHYRTIQGFQALLEKDWLSFGFKFGDRCGHLSTSDSNESSPIFTQFLDAVHQIMHQHPSAFQFNEAYLITLQEHAYSCQFGTFLANCERERQELRLSECTYSLWGYLVDNYDQYVNPLYDPETSSHAIRYAVSAQNIRFWTGLYCRFSPTGAQAQDSVVDLLSLTQAQTASLEDHGRQISKTIGQMTQMISNAKSKMMTNSSASAAASKRDELEQKFSDLTTSLKERYQQSRKN